MLLMLSSSVSLNRHFVHGFELSANTYFTSTFERSLSARRRAWPTQRIHFCRSSPCIVGRCSSFSKSVFLVRSILVSFEYIFIRVALVQSDFIMRVYVPSRSVVSSFVREHTPALYNVESFAYAQVRFTMACEFMFGAIHTATISSAVHVLSPGAGHPFHCPVRIHRIRHRLRVHIRRHPHRCHLKRRQRGIYRPIRRLQSACIVQLRDAVRRVGDRMASELQFVGQ